MADPRREWIRGGVLLVAITAAVLLLAPPVSQVAFDYRLSTYRTTPDGAGALYETLEAMGVSVDRRLTPMTGVDAIRGPLAVLEPVEPFSTAELDSLFAWVERGGRLIVSPPASLTDPGFHEHLRLVLSHAAGENAVAAPHRWTTGLDSIGAVQWAFDPDTLDGPALVPLVLDSVTGEPIVGVLRRGAGEILAIADGQLLSNDRIRTAGLAPLVVRVAAEWTPVEGALRFDEYHHGHRGGSPYRALARAITGGAAGKVVLQLIGVALLALAAAAVRFGSPRATRTASRRSPLEHVDALGEVYRQADAEGLARRRLVAGFARRLGRERPMAGEEAVFVERLERNVLTGADAAAAVSAALARGAPVPELAARIDRAIQEMKRIR
ncbi:MAG: DUF4350 domain-containing protein [Candidatus Longimicrobiales bacterium M2_2A_002]